MLQKGYVKYKCAELLHRIRLEFVIFVFYGRFPSLIA